MPHISSTVKPAGGYFTPVILAKVEGKEINVNSIDNSPALSIARAWEALQLSNGERNRFMNSTARLGAREALVAMQGGKPQDVITYNMPKPTANNIALLDAKKGSSIQPADCLVIWQTTRGQLIEGLKSLVAVDDIMTPAEKKAGEIATACKFASTVINAVPSYGTGVKAKRSGGISNVGTF